ncbi:hypothetical protein BOX15_Mlig012976g3, partial [Macrostomum lignano]
DTNIAMPTTRRRSVLQQQQQQPLSEVAPGQSEELLETPTKAKQQRTGRRQSVAKAKSKPMKGKNKSIAEIDDEQLEKENATVEAAAAATRATPNKLKAKQHPQRDEEEAECDLRKSTLLRASAQSVELKQLLQSAISERDDVSLVGRQAELETLETFLRGKASHSVLYVCGAPGSGKTAAVKTAVRKLQSVKAVRCILHNCMETGESAKSFSAQLAQLVDAKNSSANSGGDGGAGSLKLAEAAIRRFLQQQQQQSLSLVLDEIDQIDLANLRRIFRWPDSLAGAGDGNRLRVLGVANSLSLCDRLFPASATVSRPAGLRQLSFSPYTRADLLAIVTARFAAAPAALAAETTDAVRLAAGRIAASTGDARRLLEVCRRSVELADGSPTVRHVGEALKAATASPLAAVVGGSSSLATPDTPQRRLPLHLRLTAAAALRLRRRGQRQATLAELDSSLRELCSARQMPPPLWDELPSYCQSLHDTGVLRLTKAAEARMSRVALRLDDRDVEELVADPGLLADVGPAR